MAKCVVDDKHSSKIMLSIVVTSTQTALTGGYPIFRTVTILFVQTRVPWNFTENKKKCKSNF